MAIWGLIAIQVGLYLLGRLLAPRQPRIKPRPFEKPTVSDGEPITVVLGIGEMEATPELITDVSVQSGDNGANTYYLGKLQLRFGMGPVDVLYDLISDDRSIALSPQDDDQSSSGSDPTITPTLPIWRRGNPTVFPDPVVFQMHVRQLYGGIFDGEGGMEGEFRWYWGTQDQDIDPVISQVNGDLASRFPWLCHAVLGTTVTPFYLVGNTPTPKPIKAIVGCYPRRLLPTLSGRINQSANLAEMIYEVLRNRVWGKGEPESKFDVAQWQSTVRQCYAEQLGFSITLKDRRKVDDLLDDLLSHGRGVIVTDPVTGLMQLKLALLDYTENSVTVFSSTNSSKPKRGKVSFARTANEIQVRYSRFFGGATDIPLTEVVTEEVPILPYLYFIPVPGIRTGELVLPGDLPTTVLLAWDAFVNDEPTPLTGIDVSGLTERPPLGSADYYVNPRLGIFEFWDSARVSLNDKITVEYLLAPGKYAAFIDETVTRQNLSLKRTLGRTISETYDYPYCADKRNAAKIADFLIKASSRQLETFSWTADRSAARKTRGDVVQLKDAKWGGRFTDGIFVRLTKLGVGTRTKPGVTCEGIEDIYGLELTDGGELLFDPPSSGGILFQAPPVVLTCSGGGFRVGVFPVDPTFLIEIQVSSASDFSSPTTITPDGGIVYDPDLPYFDYLDTGDVPFADGTERYFRARSLPRAGYSVGPWSNVLFCIAGGDPVIPTCINATYHDEPVQGTTEGQLTTIVDADPQIRFTLLQMKTKAGNDIESAYATVAAGTAVTVAVVPGLISTITRKITVNLCVGGPTDFEQTYQFSATSVPPSPPPTGGNGGGFFPCVLHDSLVHGVNVAPFGTGITQLGPRSFRAVDASKSTKFRLVAHILDPGGVLPAPATLGAQYVGASNTDPVETDWKFLDDASQPVVPASAASALPKRTEWRDLADGALQDITVRGVGIDGDGVTVLKLESMEVQFDSEGGDGDDGTDPPPPRPPSACSVDDRMPFPDAASWILSTCNVDFQAFPAGTTIFDAREPDIGAPLIDMLYPYVQRFFAGSAGIAAGAPINGRPTIYFPIGSGRPLFNNYPWTGDETEVTCLIVLRHYSGTGLWHLGNSYPGETIFDSGSIIEAGGTTTPRDTGSPVGSIARPVLYVFRGSRTVWESWLHGVFQGSFTPNVVGGVTTYFPALGSSLRFTTGEIYPEIEMDLAEFCMKLGAASNAELADAASIVRGRWNLALDGNDLGTGGGGGGGGGAPPPPGGGIYDLAPPAPAPIRTVPVTTCAELMAAIADQQPGDLIEMAAGVFSCSDNIIETVPGTQANPITIRGAGVGVTTVQLPSSKHWGPKAAWHRYEEFTRDGGLNGFYCGFEAAGSGPGAPDSVWDTIEVKNVQQGAILLQHGSSRCYVQRSHLHDTGLGNAQFGEGVYVAGIGVPSEDVKVLQNNIHDTTAEAVDGSQGANRLIVNDNDIDGDGVTFIPNATSSVMASRGNNTVIIGNRLTNAGAPNAIEVWEGADTQVRANQIQLGNRVSYPSPVGVRFQPACVRPIYGCDNVVTDIPAGGTASNIQCVDVGDPPPPGPVGVRRLQLYGGDEDTIADYPPFSAVMITPGENPGDVITVLDAMRANGLRGVLNCVRRNEAKINGVFSQQAWKNAFYDRYGNDDGDLDLSGYTDVIDGVLIIDEYQLATSGGWGMSIPWSVVDGVLASTVANRFPYITRRYVRRDAVNVEQDSGGRSNIRYVTGVWNVHLDGRGPIATYMANQRAAATRLGIAYMWAFNPPNGGTNNGDMTPAQVRATAIPMARDVASDGVSAWFGLATDNARFDLVTNGAMVAAYNDVVAAMVQP